MNLWPNVHGENKAKNDVDNEKKGSQFFGIEDEPQVAKINAKEKAETCNYGVIFCSARGSLWTSICCLCVFI